MSIRKAQKTITPDDAKRSIYFDFESFQGEPPYLVGILCEDEFEQRVFDARLIPAADAKGVGVDSLGSAMKDLISRCEEEDRHLAAFSQHERRVVDRHLGRDIGRLYKDVRFIGKRWLNRYHHGEGWENDLKSMLKFIGFRRPKYLGDGVQTKRARDVIRGLATSRADGDYTKLTAVQKAKWTKLLKHNQIDCYGARAMVFEMLGLEWEQV